MPQHTTTRKAFLDLDAKAPLLCLYTRLVATELALKDALGTYPHTHDIDSLAKQHFGASIASGVVAQLTELNKSLANLVCTHKGAQAPVDPAKYPGVRYLQLEVDGFVGGTKSSDIEAALRDAEALGEELIRQGVRP